MQHPQGTMIEMECGELSLLECVADDREAAMVPSERAEVRLISIDELEAVASSCYSFVADMKAAKAWN